MWMADVRFAITGYCAPVLLFTCSEIQCTHIPLANLSILILSPLVFSACSNDRKPSLSLEVKVNQNFKMSEL